MTGRMLAICSNATSSGVKALGWEAAAIEDEHDKVFMINDVRRAFFEAPARKEVRIELPEEEFKIPQYGK